MSPILRLTIQAGMVRNLCQDRVEIHRFTLTEDGRGGATETWRKVAEYNARVTNQSDTGSIVGGGIQPSAQWTLIVAVAADVCFLYTTHPAATKRGSVSRSRRN